MFKKNDNYKDLLNVNNPIDSRRIIDEELMTIKDKDNDKNKKDKDNDKKTK
jgi:hypothetical protein